MTYANVVFSRGAEKFISGCAEIGIDGLILPDLPYEEKEEFLPFCRRYGIDLISMIAPTSRDRIAVIAEEAEGFLYIVSSLGVTGERKKIDIDPASMMKTVRENTDIPCAVGFGHFHTGSGGENSALFRRSYRRFCGRPASGKVWERGSAIYRGSMSDP